MIEKEKQLLFSIKIIPLITIVLFSFLVTSLSIRQDNINFKEKTNKFEKEMINLAKDRAKEEVLRLHRKIVLAKENTENILKKNIQGRVFEAHTILKRLYLENKDKSTVAIQEIMKDALRDIRFNDNKGYYSIYEMGGTNILLPTIPELEGNNFSDLKDANGQYTIRNLSGIVSSSNVGFHTWHTNNPLNNKSPLKKIGFVKYFEPYDWFIGTDAYIKDFEKVTQQELINQIHNIRYGKNGYIFVFDYEGLSLSHVNKKHNGVNRINLKDPNGYMIVQEVINKSKMGGGFINYIGTIKPSTGKPAQKTSFVMGFDDWKWAFGSGAYTSDIDKLIELKQMEFQKSHELVIQKIVAFSLILTSIFIFLSFILSRKIQHIFQEYKKRVSQEITLNKQKDVRISEQSKLASMGEMIANIAHQWRQPLSVISTSATGIIMQKENDILDESLLIDTCIVINNNAQYLSKTIDDFKNFIHGDRIKKEFLVQDSIDSFLHLIHGPMKNNDISIIQSIKNGMIINGYENELTQCLINIFNNSKDALKENISLKEQRLIFISISKQNNKVSIKIKDNAGGIPHTILPKIFEPYFTTKHKSQGTGLGLHMTYNLIVDGMNGSIQATNIEYEYENTKHSGVEFLIALPIA